MRVRFSGLAALGLLLMAAGQVGAQTPINFDTIDWLLDRGNVSIAGTNNGVPLRQGHNNMTGAGNNPQTGVRRWVWPRSIDIEPVDANGNLISAVIIDNPNPGDPLAPAGDNYQDTQLNETRVQPPPPTITGNDPQQMAHAYWFPNNAAWESPNFNVPFGDPNDYRAPGGGYSFNLDPTLPWDFDYGYVMAVHDDFIVTPPGDPSRPATSQEIAALPDTPPYVYSVVNSELIKSVTNGQPYAIWTSGDYNMFKGRYAIDLYSPGDGTIIPDGAGNLVAHPSVTRALVRVSWLNTVNPDGSLNFGNGTPGAGGVNDPQNSRIFVVDLGANGWIHLQGGGLTAPASFPYLYDPTQATPNPQDQLVVTLYDLTPDNLSDPQFAAPPVITADAVRFIPQGTFNPPANSPVSLPDGSFISPVGRIISPVVGTDKLTGNAALQQPLYFVAREEDYPDTINRSFVDPTNASSTPAPDPTALASVPVFYCIDNRNSTDVTQTPPTNIPSNQRVVWRYVGAPDNGTGTASASPALVNVRCRDGNTRPIVYFATTSADGSLGHVYALDPYGDMAAGSLTPRTYWVYPSYRPLSAAEVTANNAGTAFYPPQYHDPNYTNYSPGAYPAQTAWWSPDQSVIVGLTKYYYDGDLIASPTKGAPFYQVRSDTQITIAGFQSSPIVVDDPDNTTGPQVLILGNMNGRVFALDAGGRGDFDPNNTFAGTTQRIWTWPHFGADAYHLGNGVGPNTIKDEASKTSFPSSPSFDPSYPVSATEKTPFFIGSGEGHLFAVQPIHDKIPTIINSVPNFNNRLTWFYPALNSSLGDPVSTPAIFQGGAGAPSIYFTSGGRVYCMPEKVTLQINGLPSVNTLAWVFPFTPNPPNPNPNDSSTAPIDPGFNGTAPLMLANADAGNVGYDGCYVVAGNGMVLALDASPTPSGATAGHTIVRASGQSLTGGGTQCSPIGTLITTQLNLGSTVIGTPGNAPAVVFADDDGNIWALNTVPDTNKVGPIANTPLLPVAWAHYDSSSVRTAAAALVGGDMFTTGATFPFPPPNGMLVEGDQGGQLHGYGAGTAPPGGSGGDTVGNSEPTEGGANGDLNIDERVVDFYKLSDWQNFGLPTATETPGVQQNGTPYGNSAQPLPNGQLAAGSPAIATDWGDYLYIAAWGVYHGSTASGSSAPSVQVTFTVTQPNGISKQYTVGVTPNPNNLPDANWPDDPAVNDPTLSIYVPSNNGPLAGPANHVYPWVAKFKIPIKPDYRSPYAPSSAYKVSARAVLRQTVPSGNATTQATVVSNILSAHDNSAFGGDQGAGFNENPSFANLRPVYITNPLALTVRGPVAAPISGQPNEIGWEGDVTSLTAPDVQEILGNGNRVGDPANGTVAATIKALFAPAGSIPDGSSGTYTALDAGGNKQPALYIMDRSNLSEMTGHSLTVHILTRPLRWHGDVTSVMNPLPWEQLPNDAQSTPDYPAIPRNSFSITTSQGLDATTASVPLTPPQYPDTNPADRIPQPTLFNMNVTVPKYQPANINRGQVTYNGQTFGSNYTDIGGNTLTSILGPMQLTSGASLGLGDARTFPAGGYLSELIVETSLPGVPPSINDGEEGLIADSTNADMTTSINQAYRAFEVGITVPPAIRMKVQEQTVDLGKLPQGAGFSDIITGGGYRAPFAPSGTVDWLSSPNRISPWDDDTATTSLGVFFRPFTLVSDSNVNLFDLRVAKLLGVDGATVGAGSLTNNPPANTAVASRLASDQVDYLTIPGLFGTPYGGPGYGPGEGSIGIVSSFDHVSSTATGTTQPLFFNEHSVWQNSANPNGLANPYVIGTGAWDTLPQPATNNLAWADGFQPQPTLHKPLVGDAQGTTATIPDQPHDANTQLDTVSGLFRAPEIGVAVPIGQPTGTYANPVYVYDDNTPLQWAEWLNASGNNPLVGTNHDAILNVNANSGAPIEAHADPTFAVKVTVKEARLTGGVEAGTLSEIDPMSGVTPNANMLPAALFIHDPTANSQNLFLYWATNRQPVGSPFLQNNAQGVPVPVPEAPWSLAYSELSAPFNTNLNTYDFTFARPGSGPGTLDGAWWGVGSNPLVLFPGYDTNYQPANVATLFPSASNANNVPFLPGTITNAGTTRYASPAIAEDATNPLNSEVYLFWQGTVGKTNTTTGGSATQVTDSRTFYTALSGAVPGIPSGTILSFLNDPALNKLSPKPLFLNLPARGGFPAQKMMFLFWYAGARSQSALYYNANLADSNGVFQPTGWAAIGDKQMPIPGALAWESDPVPVYRQITVGGQTVDAIDVVYTGVLKNRQTVETLLTRYIINRATPQKTTDPPVGTLTVAPLEFALQETLSQVAGTHSYAARDAQWQYIDDSNPALIPYKIAIYDIKKGTGTPVLLNARTDGTVENGIVDKASGLITYNSALGGQLTVDPSSGTVSFPNVTPASRDTILASYVPQVMRLNASRDETNVIRDSIFNGSIWATDTAFAPQPATTAPGSNMNPVAILDTSPNPRAQLTAPQVVFNTPTGGTMRVDRLWVLYRKSDVGGNTKATIYYKSMRLLVRLPRPVMLTAPDQNGNQQIASLSVTGALGPYEVDWIRGRIYFTEADEGNQVSVTYTYADQNGNPAVFGPINYRVAWGDEISTTGSGHDPTTPEVPMPTDSLVNEGQVNAFLDPLAAQQPSHEKLWVFWSSTRAGTTDLYYQTLAPQFYPLATNQK
ncbi:MAG TPA: hypothetical protein VFA07_12640 [Chthonomonadaceae bacterium]|nr:hypothetical protein [Chthonomonadaceae bacterium]